MRVRSPALAALTRLPDCLASLILLLPCLLCPDKLELEAEINPFSLQAAAVRVLCHSNRKEAEGRGLTTRDALLEVSRNLSVTFLPSVGGHSGDDTAKG